MVPLFECGGWFNYIAKVLVACYILGSQLTLPLIKTAGSETRKPKLSQSDLSIHRRSAVYTECNAKLIFTSSLVVYLRVWLCTRLRSNDRGAQIGSCVSLYVRVMCSISLIHITKH